MKQGISTRTNGDSDSELFLIRQENASGFMCAAYTRIMLVLVSTAMVALHSAGGMGHHITMPPTSEIISRTDWGARPSKLVEHFSGPAPYVIIHHSYIPSACFNPTDCKQAMRSMQDFHQIERGWNDIGYSFAIGGDGMIYTGRGFNVIGAHAPKYNDKSVGICLIGDWRTELPPPQMLKAAKDLIGFGIAKGYIDPEFKLLGHRQVRDTECPGGRLFHEISTWPHFMAKPNSTAENEIN